VVELVEGGRRVAEVAADLGVSEQSIYAWRRQTRIDAGVDPGLTSAEKAELVSARKRIRELETEVAIHRRATELLKAETSPKDGSQRSE
jgi:transposase-like protein